MYIERTFLSPYYSTLNKTEQEKCTTPLLEDFDAEISVYMVILKFNIIFLKSFSIHEITNRMQKNKLKTWKSIKMLSGLRLI